MPPRRWFDTRRRSIPALLLAVGALALDVGCAARPASEAAHAAATGGNAAEPRPLPVVDATLGLRSRFAALMPRGLTSVGAATLGDDLYLVGGFFGSPHEYSKEFQSGSVSRLRLSTGAWEELPGVEPIQSPALLSDDRSLYKLGGMKATNVAGESTDMRSVTDAARFDPGQNRWEALPHLPEPRSSHQAVIVGHTLYVVGGWALHGGMNDNTWHGTMLTADLTQPVLAWQSVPVPFRVRAHGLAAVSGRLYVLGGLDPDGSTDAVHRYDLATGQWSDGPALPKENLTSRAAVWQGRLYSNGADGNLYRLSSDEQSWELAGAVQFPRLFHEMVSSERGPLVLGGIPDNGRGGRVRLIELLSPEPAPAGVIWTLDAESRAKNRQGAFLWSQQLFVFGGNTSLGQHDFAPENFVKHAWRLDLGALEWRSVPEFPAARQSMQALVVGADQARALVLGGFGMAESRLASHADVFDYDIAERQWTALPEQRLPEGRSQFGVAEHDGAVWIFGGMSFDAAREKDDQIRYTRQVDKLDLRQPGLAVVDAGISLAESRRAFAGALLNGTYYLVGGLKEGFEPASSCEAIDLSAKQSRSMPCPSQHRLGAELVVIAGKLYLVGGSVAETGTERRASRSIEVYDPAGQRWSVLPGAVPLDNVDQLRAFAFEDQLLLYTAQEKDAHVSVALLDPAALAEGRQDFVRMKVEKPPMPR